MSERLLILQNDRDRLVERVEALEVNAATSRGVGTPQPSDARPPLKVVKLLPHPEVEEPSATLDLGDPTAAPDSKAGQSDRVVGETEQAQRPDSNSLTGPRVVLYGEGPASGVRAVAPGDEQ